MYESELSNEIGESVSASADRSSTYTPGRSPSTRISRQSHSPCSKIGPAGYRTRTHKEQPPDTDTDTQRFEHRHTHTNQHRCTKTRRRWSRHPQASAHPPVPSRVHPLPAFRVPSKLTPPEFDRDFRLFCASLRSSAAQTQLGPVHHRPEDTAARNLASHPVGPPRASYWLPALRTFIVSL